MVLEQLLKEKWIKKKEHAFFLGFIYSLIGLVSARLIFPSSVGIMSIAFTSILLIPSLAALLKLEENIEIREKKLSISLLFKDHKDIFKVYLFLFLGIFFAYSLIALLLPNQSISALFAPQLKSAGIHGYATTVGALSGVLLNNLLVFAVSFVLSFVYGAGAVILIAWNASVWAIALAFFIKLVSSFGGTNPFAEFAIVIGPFLPHMVTEALAYISAAIVGGVVSKAVLREDLFSKKFQHITTDALIFLGIGMLLVLISGIIEVKLYAGL